MKTYHNKLVRDNIPDIIKQTHQHPITDILNDEDYLYHLKLKLIEEATEVLNTSTKDESAIEIADVLEVIEALMNHLDLSLDDVIKHKDDKANKNGKFNKRIFLKYVEEE